MYLVKSFLAIAIMFTLFANSFSNDKTTGYKVGDKVSDFSVTNYDGSTYSLSTNGAKATVVVFMSTECPFVQPYTDRLINLAKEFGSNGVTIWGVNSNKTEPIEEVMNHAKDKNYNFPVLKDVNNVVADQFGAARTPEVYVIDNNTMTIVYHGRIDDNKEADKVTSNDLQIALNEFLEGKQITNSETKAFGCSVKR
ncbi:MAG: redoxin domain-containing protein [Ignavibacteria bacterium]